MTEVVINSCYGKFGLSQTALKWMFARESKHVKRVDGIFKLDYNVPRHDSLLVKVVKGMGARANGEYSMLEIVKVKGKYTIETFDGAEEVNC